MRGSLSPSVLAKKQEKRSFSLSIRYVAKLARACPVSDLYCLEVFDFYIFFTPKQWCKMQGSWSIYTKITKYFMQNYKSGIKKDTDIFIEKLNR